VQLLDTEMLMGTYLQSDKTIPNCMTIKLIRLLLCTNIENVSSSSALKSRTFTIWYLFTKL